MRIDPNEAGEIGDIALDLDRGIPGPHRARRDPALAHDTARSDERVRTDLACFAGIYPHAYAWLEDGVRK